MIVSCREALAPSRALNEAPGELFLRHHCSWISLGAESQRGETLTRGLADPGSVFRAAPLQVRLASRDFILARLVALVSSGEPRWSDNAMRRAHRTIRMSPIWPLACR